MKLATLTSQPTYFLLTVIILLATFIRFSSLGSNPVSLYWDEVSEGYNSFSILYTGKDEWGKSFPILFKGYDDYKMPLYIYLSVIPIAVFGLSEFSVRFISAFSGVGTVLFCFLLVRELFLKEKSAEYLGLIAAFIFCIVPWHIQFSRAGFEANLALFFAVAGSYFLIRARTQKPYLYLSTLFFLGSIYSYRSSLIVIPLLFLSALIIFARDFLTRISLKIVAVSVLLFFLLSLPLLSTLIKNGDSRSAEVSIFSVENEQIKQNSIRQQNAGNTFIAKIIYNRRISYLQVAAKNYFSHFSPTYLFLKGDANPRHSVQNMGILYLWQFPAVIWGVIVLSKRNRLEAYFLIMWLLIAPIPASFSLPAPHALRTLLQLPPFIIFSAVGIFYFYQGILKRYQWIVLSILISVILMSSYIYGKNYIFHNGVLASNEWGDGYKQLIEKIKPIEDRYNSIIISGHYWQPYMYTLFYTAYNPKLYQQSGNQERFGKYIFGGTSWDQRLHRSELDTIDLFTLSKNKTALIALSPQEYVSQQKHLEKIEEIKNHLGQPIFILATLR